MSKKKNEIVVEDDTVILATLKVVNKKIVLDSNDEIITPDHLAIILSQIITTHLQNKGA